MKRRERMCQIKLGQKKRAVSNVLTKRTGKNCSKLVEKSVK
jgi:hypothetical protein